MAASKSEIKEWFQRGLDTGATHLISACDTWDWEDYPVFVFPDEDPREIVANLNKADMQRVNEVYNLSMDMDEQLNFMGAVFNY